MDVSPIGAVESSSLRHPPAPNAAPEEASTPATIFHVNMATSEGGKSAYTYLGQGPFYQSFISFQRTIKISTEYIFFNNLHLHFINHRKHLNNFQMV